MKEKLRQGVKKTSFLIFHTSLLQVKKISLALVNTSFFSFFFPLLCPIRYSVKEELMVANNRCEKDVSEKDTDVERLKNALSHKRTPRPCRDDWFFKRRYGRRASIYRPV